MTAIHPVDERLPAGKLAALGLQHVLVMYAGAIAVPLIVGRALKLPARAGGHADFGRPVLLRVWSRSSSRWGHTVVWHQAARHDGRDIRVGCAHGGHGQCHTGLPPARS
jgi:hypothetical protein